MAGRCPAFSQYHSSNSRTSVSMWMLIGWPSFTLVINSTQYALEHYLYSLVDAGLIVMIRLETPQSPKHTFVTAQREK